jgi:hypothetical protein
MRGYTNDVYSASVVLDDEERIRAVQGNGVEVKHFADQDGVRLGEIPELGRSC